MAVYGYTKNYKLIKPQFDTDTWHDYEYDNLDTIDAVLSAIFASGDWQGFWKTNTHYDAGGVVIDRDTDTMYKIMVEHTTSEATFAEEFAAHPTYYELWSPNNLAEDWAIKMDDVVSNIDYSSKAYAISSGLIDAGSAKEWAIETGGSIGTTGEYSAKKHATDAASSASTAASEASDAANSATLSQKWAVDANLVASTDYSSKSWATGSLDAGSAKDWAIKEGGQVGTTGKYSAKVYSLAAQNHYEKAVDWASKFNGLVENTDYSSKAYAISEGLIPAGSAKEWATSTSVVADGKYGASYYALQAYNANVSAQNNKTLSQEWATKMDGQVASTDYSSKYYAGQSADSANYAAGVEANIHSIVDDAAQTLSEMLNTPFFFGQSMYFENTPYNASWLASNGQYNASTLYPDFWTQLTGVELNSSLNVGDTIEISGKTYVKRGLPVVLSTGTITDYDWVVNQSEETFRLPLLNGDRILVKKYVNGADWYNLYSDGWVEQGGFAVGTPNFTVNFLKPFRDANYTIVAITETGSGDPTVRNMAPTMGQITSSSCGFESIPSYSGTVFYWRACGYAPIPTQSDFTEVSGLYYYVGDTVQDASLINAGAVLGQLSNKADIDASNFTQAGRSYLSGLGYPSDRYIDLTVLASDSNYTAPANGWFNTRWNSNSSTLHFIQFRDGTNTQIRDIRYYSTSVGSVAVISTYVRKGQQIKMRYDGASSECEYFRFYYAEGETNV